MIREGLTSTSRTVTPPMVAIVADGLEEAQDGNVDGDDKQV